ncbi:hypothetical protein [Lederbergia graminis]|uniref:Uncharacterized protein n=1 Tax=Lederbergia graminis TaxID=735518 RepID=A0ABW0LL09_9BACI
MKRLLSIIFISFMILSGCEDIDDHYSSIENEAFLDVLNDPNMVYLNFKGHSDNWAVVNIAYREKDSDRFITKIFAKYIGEKSLPTGEISSVYEAGGITKSESAIYTDVPENGMYYLGEYSSNELMPLITTKVKLQIEWNEKSEFIELESK